MSLLSPELPSGRHESLEASLVWFRIPRPSRAASLLFPGPLTHRKASGPAAVAECDGKQRKRLPEAGGRRVGLDRGRKVS